jgi:enoyl-CoA hydratase
MIERSNEPAVVSTIEGHVGRVILNRPLVLNSADPQWVNDLLLALNMMASDERIRSVVITGHGFSFCTGIDLTALSAGAIGRQWFVDWEQAMFLCETMPKPIICGIHGYCIGGGFQLALACDLRVCTTDAKLSIPAIQECLIPGMGVWRLPRYVGLGVAKRLIMTGETLHPDEAYRIGLVDYLVEPEHLEGNLCELASRLSQFSSTSYRHCKRLVNTAFDMDYSSAFEDYVEAQVECLRSPEHKDAMTSWKERRKLVRVAKHIALKAE